MAANSQRFLLGFALSAVFSITSTTAFAQQAIGPPPPLVSVEATPLPPPTTVDLLPITVPRLVLRGSAEGDSDASRTTPVSTPGADPVVSRRAERFVLSTAASLGFGGVITGLGTLLAVAYYSAGRGSGDFALGLAIVGGATWLFAIPAFYTWSSSLLGGNGTYLAALAGNAIASLASGATFIPAIYSRSASVTGTWITFTSISLLVGMGIGYEMSTTTRPASSQQARTNTRRSHIYPGFSLTESYQGVTFGGLF